MESGEKEKDRRERENSLEEEDGNVRLHTSSGYFRAL